MQIPLMDRIFGQAEAVIVYISANIGVSQADVDELVGNLEGALAMCRDEAWTTEGAYWRHGKCRNWIIQGMQGLMRLASTSWAQRVWTLQEYVLARSVVWIGLDLQPLRLDDYVLSALPDICDTLNISECLGDDMQVVFGYFQGMANVRLRTIERTRIMELLGNRRATVSVDEVYGVMAASGVTINAIKGEDKFTAWRRWWEDAVTQGHVRWALLPSNGDHWNKDEARNCAMPCFDQRHKLSASSCLDAVAPLRPPTINHGCITVSAKAIGTARILQRLGKVYETRSGRLHRDITLILFARAKWRPALNLVSAFGGGRYNIGQARSLALVLIRNYIHAINVVTRHQEEEFRPFFSSAFQLHVWNDFMSFQQSQMIGLNEGTGYLCRITGHSILYEFITVLVSEDDLSAGVLEVLHFEARSPDGRFVLMAIESSKGAEGSAHKIGMTLPVSDDLAELWSSIPVSEFRIGGKQCSRCNDSNAGTGSEFRKRLEQPLASQASASTRSQLRTATVLERRLRYLSSKAQHERARSRHVLSEKTGLFKNTRSRRKLRLNAVRLHAKLMELAKMTRVT